TLSSRKRGSNRASFRYAETGVSRSAVMSNGDSTVTSKSKRPSSVCRGVGLLRDRKTGLELSRRAQASPPVGGATNEDRRHCADRSLAGSMGVRSDGGQAVPP